MTQHSFIFKPGIWLGEGNIVLNMVDEELGFFTRWNMGEADAEGNIECLQEIQVKGLSDVMMNQFTFSGVTPASFLVELENHAVGRVEGNGVVNDKVVGWEFRIVDIGFEGFEFYEKQDDGSYLVHAEYATSDQFRTVIRGKLWQSTQPTEGQQ